MLEYMENSVDEIQEAQEPVQQEMGEGESAAGEVVGYSPEAVQNAWAEYERLNEREREKFLRGHSRNAHIMNAELRHQTHGETAGSASEAAETDEDPEAVGYSSSYYEHQMASALKNGNKIAYDNAKSNWAKAKVKESVGASGEAAEDAEVVGYRAPEATRSGRDYWEGTRRRPERPRPVELVHYAVGEGEYDETAEESESVGYSSSYYEHEMASALKSGNKIAYDNAKSNWAKAKVKESVGAASGEGEAVPEGEESVGTSAKFWLNKATNDLAEGYRNGYKINMERYYDALKKE